MYKSFFKSMLIIISFYHSTSYAEQVTLLDLTDRGSVTNTPYTLSNKSILIESGYQYKHLNPLDQEQAFPQMVFFLGLPFDSEVGIALPVYNQLSSAAVSLSGYSATVISAKKELVEGINWLAAAEVILTVPGGSNAFGSQGIGSAINGMFSYKIDSQFSLTTMLGVSSLTESSLDGGRRFNSFNPSFVLSYFPTEKIYLFAEFFGQTKINPYQGSNYNVDGGFLYLFQSNIVFDIEVGRQLTHQINQFQYFLNGGVSIQFN